MKNTSRFLKSIFTLLIVVIVFFSCKKETSKIGLDIVGENPLNVLFSDTTNVEVFSLLRDSVRTDENATAILGVVVDPVFGTTKASLYMQYNLSLANYSFGEAQAFDSLVLSVPYINRTVFGDSLSPLSIRVYELNERLEMDTSYYSTDVADYLPTLLGEISLVPKPYDSVLIDTNLVAPHFSLRLSDELGQRLLALEDTLYYDNDDFLDAFKGLYFEPVYEGGVGNLTFLNMRSTLSKITLYYHNSVSDSLSYNFFGDNYSASFQNIDHLDYIGSDPDFYRQVIEKDTTMGKQKFYLQTLGGVDSYIRFPSLFKNEDFAKYAINEAKLIITNIDPESNFAQPNSLVLFQKRYSEADSSAAYYYTEDASAGEAYFGGTYNTTSKQYEFRITKFLQDYIAGTFDYDHLLMQISGANYSASRFIGGGSDPSINPESKIKLEIIYTDVSTDTK